MVQFGFGVEITKGQFGFGNPSINNSTDTNGGSLTHFHFIQQTYKKTN